MTANPVDPYDPLTEVDEELARLEAARHAQLEALPPVPKDLVAGAHLGTVTRILEQIRTARGRLRDGLYGICAGCNARIHPDRLEPRPWLTTCVACAPAER